MALLQPPLLTPPQLCCCSHACLYPGFLKLPPKFSNGASSTSTARPSDRSELLVGKRGALAWRASGRQRRRPGVTGAGRGPFFGSGGRRMDKATGRVVGNLAFAAVVTYLAVTGQLRWVIDAIVSLWLLTILLPVLALGAFFFFAGQDILQGDCPNCGKSFQILKSALKDGPQLCPYCTQPFSVQGNKFVRESARFSSGRGAAATNGQVFNEFFNRDMRACVLLLGGTSFLVPWLPEREDLSRRAAASGTIVDVEAEVKDVE